jgi:hypothetical protein
MISRRRKALYGGLFGYINNVRTRRRISWGAAISSINLSSIVRYLFWIWLWETTPLVSIIYLTHFEQDHSFATRLSPGSDAWRVLNSLVDQRVVCLLLNFFNHIWLTNAHILTYNVISVLSANLTTT